MFFKRVLAIMNSNDIKNSEAYYCFLEDRNVEAFNLYKISAEKGNEDAQCFNRAWKLDFCLLGIKKRIKI